MEREANGQKVTARERVLDAARDLFAEHGVSGTSLQMIADHLGVTKAAVYHQFHTKDQIVLALVERPMQLMVVVLLEAEAEETRQAQLDVLLAGLVDLVLANPEEVSLIQRDPEVVRVLQTHDVFHDIAARLDHLLAGPHPDPASRIASALFGAGLLLMGHHPLLSDMSPDTMREELPRIGRRMLL
jgi:AcrR family transcriptional regulator